MKAAILFHSVTGSCYDMAMTIGEQFGKCGLENQIYRIEDKDQQKWAEEFDWARKSYDGIMSIPQVCLNDIPNYDIVVLISPTYFGNVSSEVKSFMDDMACFWLNKKMAGKLMLACTSASTYVGGGDLALQSINTFAQHLGMIPYPMNSLTMPAYGLMHITGEQSQIRVNDTDLIKDAVTSIAKSLVAIQE